MGSCASVRLAGTDIHYTGACKLGARGQGQSCGIQQARAWWQGSTRPAGASAATSPRQEPARPIRDEPRTLFMHANTLVQGGISRVGVDGRYGYGTSHTLPEQVSQVEEMWPSVMQSWLRSAERINEKPADVWRNSRWITDKNLEP